jgi:uncharacterized membrane protein
MEGVVKQEPLEQPVKEESEAQAEEIMSNVLRWGILATSLIVLIGAVIFLFREGFEIPDYSHFDGNQTEFNTLSVIFSEALSFHGRGIIQFGLLLLICVPIVRVAVSIYTFAMQSDITYVIVSIIVLTVLVYSFVSSNV